MKSTDFICLPDVLELMLDAVCVVDREGNFVFVSAAFEKIFGYKPEEVIGTPMINLVYQEDQDVTLDTVSDILSGEEKPHFENRWVHKSGRVLTILWSARWSEKHQVRIAVAHDISARKEMEEKLLHMAGHDHLTDLPNRSLFLDRLKTGLARARRERTYLSLLFIDIDDFKQVNDQYGHVVGDKLLQAIANRLKECIRESDSIARQGGDEFLVLLNGIKQEGDAVMVAEKIREVLEKPYEFDSITLNVSASIGVAHYPDHAEDFLELIQHADQAMYLAKNTGGNKVCVFQF